MPHLSRRAASDVPAASPSVMMSARPSFAASATPIRAGTWTMGVKGRVARAHSLTQPDGGHRLVTEGGAPFCMRLENEEPPIHRQGSTISKGSCALPATGGKSGPHDHGQCRARRRDSSLSLH